MNVLLLTDKLKTGGAEIYFCKLMNKLHHDNCHFYAAAGPGELYEKLTQTKHFWQLDRNSHLKNIRKLRKVVTEKDINIIHANSLRMVFYSIILQSLARKPVQIIYTKHNVTYLEKQHPALFSKIINKHVGRVITVSECEKDNLVDLGVDSRIIVTVHNGVDLQQFTFKRDSERNIRKVGILARLSKEKNIEFFIDVANTCKNRLNMEFLIGGVGTELEQLETKINQLNLQENVKMVGAVNKPEEFLKSIDILLLTSHREVFPMVILEAMAVGTPIISIDRGGVGEAVIDKSTGILISQHDKNQFAEQIEILTNDESIRRHVIINARAKVEKEFSLDAMVNDTLSQYIDLHKTQKEMMMKEREAHV
ncbi:glycosyltransferase family 4 protein [Thalassorhabdus alkalitolerans]|uniref:Glycosyltransferase family 4 protein n=1 Tax=Thalassorhabdus alkalitolerans TaxID=2282697 RepID=A0ABW0YNN8_9BACI